MNAQSLDLMQSLLSPTVYRYGNMDITQTMMIDSLRVLRDFYYSDTLEPSIYGYDSLWDFVPILHRCVLEFMHQAHFLTKVESQMMDYLVHSNIPY